MSQGQPRRPLDPHASVADPVVAAYRNSLRSEMHNNMPLDKTEELEKRVKDLTSQLRLAKRKEHDATAQSAELRKTILGLEKQLGEANDELFEATELCVQQKSALAQYRRRTQELEAALNETGRIPSELSMSPDMRRLVAVEKELSSTKKQHMQLLAKHEETLARGSGAGSPSTRTTKQPPHQRRSTVPIEKCHVATNTEPTTPLKPTQPDLQQEQDAVVTSTLKTPQTTPSPLVDGACSPDARPQKPDPLLGALRKCRLESMEHMLQEKNSSILELREVNSALQNTMETSTREFEGAKAKARLFEATNKQMKKELEELHDRLTILEREKECSEEAVRAVPQLKLKLQLLEGELSTRDRALKSENELAQQEKGLLVTMREANHKLDVSTLLVEESEARMAILQEANSHSTACWDEKSRLSLKLFGLDGVLQSVGTFADI